MMGELEGRISGSVHYDNVAPCYLGGLQLILEQMALFVSQYQLLMIGIGLWHIQD